MEPKYDRNGNMTLIPPPLGPGNLGTVEYDAWNRAIYFEEERTRTRLSPRFIITNTMA
jgi:hypothetical protein